VAKSLPYQRPSYRSVVRNFGNGEAEICTHLITQVPSPSQLLDRDMAAAGLPILYRPVKVDKPAADLESNHERATRRAKQAIRWRVKGQLLDHMITLTVRENLRDVDQLKALWAKFRRLVEKKTGKFAYCAVVEEQKRGALHIHCAVSGRQNVHVLRGSWWAALGHDVIYVNGAPKLSDGVSSRGNVDITNPMFRRRSGKLQRQVSKWRPRNVASYLSKYIAKCLDNTAANSRKYWASTGFKCPKEVVFLQAECLRDALLETSSMFESLVGRFVSPWKSPDWSCIWVSS